jgi:hypothetical protein
LRKVIFTTKAGDISRTSNWNRLSSGQSALTSALIASSFPSASDARSPGACLFAPVAFNAVATMSAPRENSQYSVSRLPKAVGSSDGASHASAGNFPNLSSRCRKSCWGSACCSSAPARLPGFTNPNTSTLKDKTAKMRVFISCSVSQRSRKFNL